MPVMVKCVSHVAQSVWLRAGRPDDRGSIPGRGERICPLTRVQTGSGAHPASCPMGKARPERDADRSSPSSAEVDNE
jgi:hypothetical protein